MKKVTAKRLMIGDWVMWKGEYRKVVGLWLNYDRDSLIDLGSVISTKSATPIPITEEWLMLNGFKKHFDTFFMNLTANTQITFVLLYFTLRIYRENEIVSYTLNIQYIHQLQQAYRLATGGKELKLKF